MLTFEEGQVSLAVSATGFAPIRKAMFAIDTYLHDGYEKEYYDSKNQRIRDWNPEDEEVYELVISIFTVTLMEERVTIQAMIGKCSGKIDLPDPLDRAKTTAECIALCAHADLIEIDMGDTYWVYTNHNIDTGLARSDKHVILTKKPRTKTDNQILGCRYKQHTGDTCLSHINAMNSIKYALNLPLIRMMEEQATFVIDTTQKAKQWDLFISESYRKYLELARGDNEFFLEWKYDTRGRCYSEGWYINPQGTSFKKAICQLANKEIVEL